MEQAATSAEKSSDLMKNITYKFISCRLIRRIRIKPSTTALYKPETTQRQPRDRRYQPETEDTQKIRIGDRRYKPETEDINQRQKIICFTFRRQSVGSLNLTCPVSSKKKFFFSFRPITC